jgi:hypothetical protein
MKIEFIYWLFFLSLHVFVEICEFKLFSYPWLKKTSKSNPSIVSQFLPDASRIMDSNFQFRLAAENAENDTKPQILK